MPRRPLCVHALAAVLVLVALSAPAAQSQRTAPVAESIELTGTIDPATSAWVSQALEDAAPSPFRFRSICSTACGPCHT